MEAPESFAGAGSAYVFTQTGGTWTQQANGWVALDCRQPEAIGTRIEQCDLLNTCQYGFTAGGVFGHDFVLLRSRVRGFVDNVNVYVNIFNCNL